jgi:hypothetical protein
MVQALPPSRERQRLRLLSGALRWGGLGGLLCLSLCACHKPSEDAYGRAQVGLPPAAPTAPPSTPTGAPSSGPNAPTATAPPLDPALEKQLIEAVTMDNPSSQPGDDTDLGPDDGTDGTLGTDPHAGMGGQPTAVPAPPAAGDPSQTVSGLIAAAPSITDTTQRLTACPTLFLVAFPAGGGQQVPVAVRKISLNGPNLPIDWELDGSMPMIPGGPAFAGQVSVMAYTDKDGDASTQDSGCLAGDSGPVTVPQQHVTITLDKVLP